MSEAKSVAIIGAGPVGLAAAAHVLERGLRPIVLEAGDSVGHSVRQWGHVQLFSPWEYNIDRAAARLLAPTGWNSPDPQQYPTGAELLERYLEPLATKTGLADHIHTSSRVTDISRAGFDKLKTKGREAAPFEIRYQNGQGPEGREGRRRDRRLRHLAFAQSGRRQRPPRHRRGAGGGQDRLRHARRARKDRARYAGKTVAVLGAGHSAIGTLTDLARLATEVPETQPIWLLRGNDPAKAFGGGANDKLVARGELGAAFAALVTAGRIRVESEFRVSHLTADGPRLIVATGAGSCCRQIVVDELIVATGFRPDLDFVRELRIQLDPAIECPVALAPLIDPNEHSCGTVRPHGARELAQDEPGFYFAGMKSYGRAPTFLMLTGYEQVRSIAAEIAGDHEAARRVELVLPETGVCSRSAAPSASQCCGGPAPSAVDACCVGGCKCQATRQNRMRLRVLNEPG